MKSNFGIIVVVGLLFVGAGCTNAAPGANADGSPKTTTAEKAPAQAANALDLSGQGMAQVPMSVFQKSTLEELDVSNNALTGALPSQIQGLKHLRVLKAGKNQMTGIPAEIGQLSELQVLDLSNNKLTGLPMELGNLQKLRILDLRGNTVSKQDLDGIRAKLQKTSILE